MNRSQKITLAVLAGIALLIWCGVSSFVLVAFWQPAGGSPTSAPGIVLPTLPAATGGEITAQATLSAPPAVALNPTPLPTATSTRVVLDTATPTASPPAPVRPTATPRSPVSSPVGSAQNLIPLHQLHGHTAGVAALAFTPDGIALASGDLEGVLRLWRVSDGTLLYTLEPGSSVFSLAVSPDGTTLAAGLYNGHLKLWRISDGTLLHDLESPFSRVYDIAFSQDGKLLAAARQDGNVQLWQVSDGTLWRTLEKQDGYQLRGVAFAPDGQTLASLSAVGGIRLWQVSDGTPLQLLEAGGLESRIFFSPDGTLLAIAKRAPGEVALWRVSDGVLVQTLEPVPLASEVLFSSDGKTLISTSSTNKVYFWQISDGTLLKVLERPKEAVTCADCATAISRDGTLVVSGTLDGILQIWQIP